MTVYRHISEARKAKELSVSLQCELLGVSESGYWAWAKRAPSDRALYDAWLIERIKAIHAASKGRYGSPQGARDAAPRRRPGRGEARGAADARRRACRAPTGAAARAARSACRALSRSAISSAATSGPTPRTASGARISSRSGPARAGCIWPRSRISSAAGSSAGRWPAHAQGAGRGSAPDGRHGAPARAGHDHHSDHGGQFISLTFGQACHDAGIAQSMGAVGSCFDKALAS